MAGEGNPHKGSENLIPNAARTPEELREITRAGGIKSGEVRREKKLMSQIYAEFLAEEHDIELDDGQIERMSGARLVAYALTKVIGKGGSAAVAASKELREGTEGNKVAVSGGPLIVHHDDGDGK